jgi:hypothetical protein
MGLVLQLWLTWLAMFLALLETLTIEILSVFSGRPSRIFGVEDSAVLILNAEDGTCMSSTCGYYIFFIVVGVGRSTALKYSELGYTVFALCPDHQRGAAFATREPSSVSSASNTMAFASNLQLTKTADTVFLASQEGTIT